MNLKYKISSCLHISITTTAHLMLVFLNVPQDFVLKIIITGEKKEPDLPVSDQGCLRAFWLASNGVLYVYLLKLKKKTTINTHLGCSYVLLASPFQGGNSISRNSMC